MRWDGTSGSGKADRGVTRFPEAARDIAPLRPAVQAALRGESDEMVQALRAEEEEARRKDRVYWEPIKRDLEEFRRKLRELAPPDESGRPEKPS